MNQPHPLEPFRPAVEAAVAHIGREMALFKAAVKPVLDRYEQEQKDSFRERFSAPEATCETR